MKIESGLSEKDFTTFFKFIKLNNNFNKLWKLKSSARQVLKEWLISMDYTHDVSELVSNASCELMENIIKFAKENESAFMVVKVKKDSSISIETYNKSEKCLRIGLRSFLQNLKNEHRTIRDLYVDRVRQAILSDESKLGIIKILLETGGNVELVDEGDDELVHIKFSVNIRKYAS